MFDGKKVTISNDGATIMKQLDIAHPAAKTLVDISMSQDAEVGDGTTSVVLLAAEMLKQVKIFVEDEVHPQILIRGVRLAAQLAVARIKEIAIKVDPGTPEARQMLEVFASTALNSKLISNHKKLFSPMVVDAVCCLDTNLLDLSLIGVKKVQGGSVTSSFLVQGVAFKKTFSYAGFEQMTKTFTDPKVLLLNVELELKSEKENAEVRITDVSDYQKIVDAEWKIIYDKLDKCVACGAQIILSKLPIGDLATQYFADRKLFCAGRVTPDDMNRVAKATGGVVQTSVNDLTPDVLGSCGAFEEERDRSIHDALMIVKRGIKSCAVVAGGGAIETELSRYLREYARGVEGKPQLVITAVAKALEIIPRQLAENAGFDSTDVLNKLRQKHAVGDEDPDAKWFGVNCDEEGITNTLEANVWEPAINKENSLMAAAEAACVILSIDETVRNPRSDQAGAADASGVSLAQQQRRVSAAMGGQGMQGLIGAGRGGRGGRRGVRRMK